MDFQITYALLLNEHRLKRNADIRQDRYVMFQTTKASVLSAPISDIRPSILIVVNSAPTQKAYVDEATFSMEKIMACMALLAYHRVVELSCYAKCP